MQYFTNAQTLKRHAFDCFKANDMHMIETDKKMKMLNLKLGEKNQMTIHDFCWFWKCFNSLVPENNEKQNPEVSYTNNYENHVGYNYCYKLECVNDHFSWHI